MHNEALLDILGLHKFFQHIEANIKTIHITHTQDELKIYDLNNVFVFLEHKSNFVAHFKVNVSSIYGSVVLPLWLTLNSQNFSTMGDFRSFKLMLFIQNITSLCFSFH
jgi:hypothetical protein